MKTWEVGYKTLIQNRLAPDALYFNSQYTGLLTTQAIYQPTNGLVADFAKNAYRTLSVNANSLNDVFVQGWAVGGEFINKNDFVLSGNFAHQTGTVTLYDAQGNVANDKAGTSIVKRKMSDPDVAAKGRNYFNSPENRYTLSLSNDRLTDRARQSPTAGRIKCGTNRALPPVTYGYRVGQV